jgi:hypothetical protein
MQTSSIVSLAGVMSLSAVAAHAAPAEIATAISAALPWMLALAALPMVLTVAARPVDVPLHLLGQYPLTGLPRLSFLATKMALVVLMAMVAVGMF